MNVRKRTILCVIAICLLTVATTSLYRVKADPGQNIQQAYPELEKPTIVVFRADWCAKCDYQAIQTINLRSRQFRVRVYDVDKNEDLADHLGVNKVPYTALVKDHKIVKDWVGITGWRVIDNNTPEEYRSETQIRF